MSALDEYRKELDQIDENMTRLLEARMRIAEKIAAYKLDHHVPVLDARREREVLDRITRYAAPDMAYYTRTMYSNIMEMSKDHQRKAVQEDTDLVKSIKKAMEETPKVFPATATIACAGVLGAYAQHACDKLFKMPQIMYLKNLHSVFAAIDSGLCQYGVLPVENSTAGSINQIYDLLSKHGFYIVKSIKLKVDHSLLAKKGTKKADIKRIYASENAAWQCDDYLKNFPQAELILCDTTADGAKIVAEADSTECAALASFECGMLYGLSCLEEGVQDQSSNYTRFICISKNMEIYPGADKLSLKMEVSHKAGSLYQVLARFNSLGLNILKLESRPIPKRDFEQMLYIDVDANVYSEEFYRLMNQLAELAHDYQYLGSYMEI